MSSYDNLPPPTILRDDQSRFIGSIYNKIRRDYKALIAHIIFTSVFLISTAIIIVVDFVLLRALFTFLLSGNGETSWDANVLALAGVVIIIGLHIYAAKRSSRRVEKGMDFALLSALSLFILGAGFQLAAGFYVNGVDALQSSNLDLVIGSFLGEAVQENAPPTVQRLFETWILPVFPILFTLGMGCLFIVTCLSGHVLIRSVARNIEHILAVKSRFRIADAAIREIRERETLYSARRQDLVTLTSIDSAELDRRFVDKIVSTGLESLRPAERALAARELHPVVDEFDELFSEPMRVPTTIRKMDVDALRERVGTIRNSLTAQNILQIIRGH